MPRPKLGENRICPVCSKEYYAKKAHIDRGWLNYCSISCSKKGKIPPNILIAQAASPCIKKGHPGYMKGKKRIFTEEWKNNLAEANRLKAKSGNDHWNWQGGKTNPNHKIRTSTEYKEWRMKVFQRDRFACVECGYRSHKRRDIVADHIKPFFFFPELRLDINNGRTLCKECDKKIAFNYERDKHLYLKTG